MPGGTGNGGTQQTPGGTGNQGGTGQFPGGTGNRMGGGNRGGGSLLNGSTPSAALTTLLKTDAGNYTWVAATIGSNSASGYQLATGDPVMAIGGFNGTDPTPTLAAFEQYVSAGRIHYFIAGGGMGFGGSSSSGTSSQISQWVEQNFTATTVGGVTVYDLTKSNAGTTNS